MRCGIETETEMERLREELATREHHGQQRRHRRARRSSASKACPPTRTRRSGRRPNEVAGELRARAPATGGAYTFTMRPNIQVKLRDEAVVQARQTIERRVNELGVTEPSIAQQGRRSDPGAAARRHRRRAREGDHRVARAARAEDRRAGAGGTKEELLVERPAAAGHGGRARRGGAPATPAARVTIWCKQRGRGHGARSAQRAARRSTRTTGPAVSFTLNTEGGRKFGKVTGENIGRQLAIVLDGRVQSAPTHRRADHDRRAGSAAASRRKKCRTSRSILRSGALPASLNYLEERTIGPSARRRLDPRPACMASVVGLLLVISFMLVYYKLSGVNAVVALVFNLIILLGLMAYIGAVMTLPGIAGFVLTMGIGVDSNVLIFERIKEELEAQRGVRAAINAGFSRVFLTLLDTHIAALISALFLFQFGTGPIRGFAVTLFIGLVSNLFTSTFVSKTLFELALARRRQVADAQRLTQLTADS